MLISLPQDVQTILAALSAKKHCAYAVGGCVRDSLMGITPKDWDIATSAQPHEVKAIFPYTADTGIEHGTVTVVLNHCNYEVTTFRIDGTYLDGRRPNTVAFTTNLEEDLSRRDFTMNAIAYNPTVGIVDPFGGIKDIRKKNIRCVGHAPSRFEEDALRMMRVIRFSAQLSFAIDPNTYWAIPPLATRLSLVSIERIREELTKILSSKNPNALPMLQETNLWPQVLRGIYYDGNLTQTAKWLKQCPKEPAMLYALLFPKKTFMRHLKFDNRTVNETAIYGDWLERFIPNERYAAKLALNAIGPRCLSNLLILKKIIQPENTHHWEAIYSICGDILKSGECFTLKDLAADGQMLIKAGIPPGKAMGQVMSDMLNMVMKNPSLNEKESLINLAKKLILPHL